MIFLSNAAGEITAAIPEAINQGSVGVNRIVLIAPFPSTSVVSATFTLPNGIKIYPKYVGKEQEDNYPYLMGVVGAFSDKMLTIDGVTVNAWQLTLDKAITQVAGNVTVQFLVTSAYATGDFEDPGNGEYVTTDVQVSKGQVLSTTPVTLPINRGNAYLSPSVSVDDLDTIEEYLSAALQAQKNAEKALADINETIGNAIIEATEQAVAKATEDANEAAASAESDADRAEAQANRASPWSLVATQANIYTVLQGLSSITAKSILFLNVDFTSLDLNEYVNNNAITFVFHDSSKKVEFRGCNFGTLAVRLRPASAKGEYISGVNGGNVIISGFSYVEDCICYSISSADSVINCNCHSVLSCDNITGTKATVFSSCNRISASEGTTFTNCKFVDPFTVNGFVPSGDTGKVPTLNSDGAYIPKPLASRLDLSVDSEYKITATLVDVNNSPMSKAEIDLPLESVVVKATVSEEDGQKFLILTLQNGEKTKIPLEDIFRGLATKDWVNAQISDVNTTINGIGTRVTALENGLEAAETDISTLKEDMSAAETEIEELKTSKLDSAGLTHSYDGSANTSFGVGDGVVIHSRRSDGEIVIQGYETIPGGHDTLYFTSITARGIAGIPYADIARKTNVEALETQNTILKKRVDNIEGAAIDFVADSTKAVTKIVPTDALPYAKIMKIGGKLVRISGDDLISAPVSELVVEGANLIPFPYAEGGVGSVIEKYGVTFTVNSDGSITINGTSTEFATFALSSDIAFKAGETYARAPSVTGISFVISYIEADTTQYLPTSSFTWGDGWTFNSAYLQISPGTTVNNVTFYPIINRGSTTLPYRPYFKSTFPIPEAVRPANGINANVYDYIEWEADGTRKKYVCIGNIVPSVSKVYTRSNGNLYVIVKPSNIKVKSALLSTYEVYIPVEYSTDDSRIYCTGTEIVINDNRFISVDEANNILKDIVIYYELATPIVTDISNILTPDNYIEVEGGGTITAVTERMVSIPTTIYYATEKTGG